MIITCPNCNKQFKIDSSLIPNEGRDLQCGSCNNVWFYKIEEENSNFNSVSVSEELSHPIKGFLVGSLVINSKIHLFFFAVPDCIGLLLGMYIFAFFIKWSEWQDSNLRPSGPKPDALPGCATLRSEY